MSERRRLSAREAALYLGTNSLAFTKWLRTRAVLVNGMPVVSVDGIDAVYRDGSWWIQLSEPWLVGPSGWTTIDAVALACGVSADTLRRGLDRNVTPTKNGVEATYLGVRARKLGERWRCCFETEEANSGPDAHVANAARVR